jgi:hypothetical protein
MADDKRRKEDTLAYRIKYLGAISVALLGIGAIIIAFGNTQWQPIRAARESESRLDLRIQAVEKDNVAVKERLQSIDDRTKMIWEAVKK